MKRDKDDEITGILQEHLVTEKVEVPNHLLEAKGWLARTLGRRTMRFRYLPVLKQLSIQKRFRAKMEVSGDMEVKLLNAQIRVNRDQATPADIKLLQEDSNRWNDGEISAALYHAVIVKPRMSERQVSAFLESLDPVDMDVWTVRTSKFLNLTEEDQKKIKNLSGPRRSPTSPTSSMNTGAVSEKSGRGREPRSTNTN
jgi:hypothetical protein